MIFAIEKLKDCWDEIMVLAERHWNETQNFRHEEGFNPKFERYQQQEEWGNYIQFTARENGELIGYGGVYIVPSMHSQELMANEDTWFMAPEHRKGWDSIKFFRFMEDECKRRGAKSITLSAPVTTRAETIHRFLGYKKVAVVSYKRI